MRRCALRDGDRPVIRTDAEQLRAIYRNVDRGVLGDARLITSAGEIRRRNDFWDGKGRPEEQAPGLPDAIATRCGRSYPLARKGL